MKFIILRKNILVIFFVLGMLNNTIAQYPKFEASVISEIDLPGIHSASGIVKLQNRYYLVGDDSPYLFSLNQDYEITDKIPIYSTKRVHDERISKKDKPDFESITIVPWGKDEDILIFGSGSSEKRTLMVRIDFDDDDEEVETYSMKKIYKKLSKESDTEREMNIEGAGFWNNNLILLNRTDNTLFRIDFDDFREYVSDKDKDKPKIKSAKFNLPEINGMSARFSGMCLLPDEDILVFTASIENDPNWINQESIIGSYLGIIDLDQLENSEPVCTLIKKNNKPFTEKVESVYVLDKNATLIQLVGVIDNDDGSSKLVEIVFEKTGS